MDELKAAEVFEEELGAKDDPAAVELDDDEDDEEMEDDV